MSETARLISFYLPQYHPIPENDEWWGEGFTDWANVTKAKPIFSEHYQPHIPADLGFYDLRVPEVREAQAALASEYGIHGFCYHHYWFAGHRLLERPFNEVLASGRPDFPFCLCWANENWTRRWDGKEHEILIQQRHSDKDDIYFIRTLFPAFKDKRYIRVNDRPILIVYRTDLLPNPARTAMIWREEMKTAGLEDLYLCRAETFTIYDNYVDPTTIGFDSAVEFPPHAIWSGSLRRVVANGNREFKGEVLDYEQVVYGSLMRSKPSYKLFRGVMPSWDNTARKPHNGIVFANSSPELYQEWLADCIRWTRRHYEGDERLLFINAWNEWAEGCHLEPDRKFGHRYLEATRDALQTERSLSEALLESKSFLSGRDVSSKFIEDTLSRYASELLRTNMILRIKLKERGIEVPPLGIVRDSSGLHAGEVTLSYFLSQYLRSNNGTLRRTRKLLYRVLRYIWRMGGYLTKKFRSIDLFGSQRSQDLVTNGSLDAAENNINRIEK